MKSRETVKNIIMAANGKIKSDLCIKNVKVVDVFNKEVFNDDVYIKDGYFVGWGDKDFPKAEKEIDAKGMYMTPGLIDSHVHIESSHVIPSEYAKLVIPHGTTTVIADPHEICNVTGLDGLDFMLENSEGLPLDVFFQFPSCVPCTPFENAGAILKADSIKKRINNKRILGLGELMDYVGVINTDDDVIDKILLCTEYGKIIDGHSPGIFGKTLDSYSSVGIRDDHECGSREELKEHLKRGMYVMLRQGTVCHDLVNLVKGVNKNNENRILMCTDDCAAKTLIDIGHIDNNVRLAIGEGIEPISAVCMASFNASLCFSLKDRGAIAPGYKADFILTKTLDKNFTPIEVYKNGVKVAENGKLIAEIKNNSSSKKVESSVNIKELNLEMFSLKLKSDKAKVIEVIPGSVVTKSSVEKVERDKNGEWKRDNSDIVKIAVIERHKKRGTYSVGLIKGLGLKGGAVATTVSHDSHNLIVAGDNSKDMLCVAKELEQIGGGMSISKGGKILFSVAHKIAGLMTDKSGKQTAEELDKIEETTRNILKINKDIDPFMTLCFMSLIVIPDLKISDQGLFDVNNFKFTDISV